MPLVASHIVDITVKIAVKTVDIINFHPFS